MAIEATIVDKHSHDKVVDASQNINLTKASVVELPLRRAEIKSIEAEGTSVIVTTVSGEVIVIKNFYADCGDVGNDLVLKDDAGAYWHVQGPGFANAFVPLDVIDPLLIYSDALTPWLLSGSGILLGSAGLVALARDHHHADGSTDLPTLGIDSDNVTADNMVNIAEAAGKVLLTGRIVGDMPEGAMLIVRLNGRDYQVQVGNDGAWSLEVDGAELMADADKMVDLLVVRMVADGQMEVLAEGRQPYQIDGVAPNAQVTQVAVDPIEGMINGTDPVTISGQIVGDFQSGDVVRFEVNGTPYSAIVDANGRWSVAVAGADLVASEGAPITVRLDAHDSAGNLGQIDTTLPPYQVAPEASQRALVIDHISGNDFINAAEVNAPVTISGHVAGHVEPGEMVTVSIGGLDICVHVDDDGNWSMDVPGVLLGLAGDGTHTLTAVLGDHHNGLSANRDYTIDTVAPSNANVTLTIDPVTADNSINDSEAAGQVLISGSASGDVAPGSVVRFTLGGTPYSAVLGEDLTWSVSVPGADLVAQGGRNISATLTAVDAAGNTGTVVANHSYQTNITVPPTPPVPPTIPSSSTTQLTVNPITADNVINAAEAGNDALIVSGTVSGLFRSGDSVSFVLNGVTHTTTVNGQGLWSVTVTGSDLVAHTGQVINATLIASNGAGGTGTITATRSYGVDTEAPSAPVIETVVIAGDGIVDATEACGCGKGVEISGTVSGDFAPGDTVIAIVTFNGKDYPAQVDENGCWTVLVPADELAAAGEGAQSLSVTVTATDAAGNSNSTQADVPYTVDTTTAATTVVVGGDGIVNGAEAGAANVPVSGTVSGQFAEGDEVIVTVNGVDYPTTVAADGSWTVNVPGAQLADAGEGVQQLTVTINATDGNGNPTTPATSTHGYTVDTTPPNAANVTSAVVAGDNNVDATEAGSASVPVSGTYSGTFNTTDTIEITVTANGRDYPATVQPNGNWTANVDGADLVAAGQGAQQVTVTTTVTDAAGNPTTTQSNAPYTVGTTTTTTTVVVGGDGIINDAEAGAANVPVSGTVSGDFAEGDEVIVSVNGTDYPTTVAADGSWTVNVPGAQLDQGEGAQQLTVTVNPTDGNGNPGTPATSTHGYTVDTTPPNAANVTSAVVAGDNNVDATEAGSASVPVSGTISGGLDPTDTVEVTVTANGRDYPATVQPNGNWTANVDGADLVAAGQGAQQVTVTTTVTDAAGNPTTTQSTVPYTVDTLGSVATTVVVGGDGIINDAEAGAANVPVSGTVSGDFAEGDEVIVTVNGVDYPTTVAADGSWTVNVPGAQLDQGEGAQQLTVTVNATDGNGNPGATATSTHGYTVDTTPPNAANLNSIVVAGDDFVNIAEGNSNSVPVSGTYSGTFNTTDTIEITVTVNGRDYPATVQPDGTWTANVDGADLKAAGQGAQQLTVTSVVTDAAGNPTTTQSIATYTVDTVAPQNTATTVVVGGDDYVNADEAVPTQDVPVSGQVTGDFRAGDTVTVAVGGRTYPTQVAADGTWSVGVPGDVLATNGEGAQQLTVTVVGTDAAGNTNEVNVNHPYTVDTVAPGAAVLDSVVIATDDVVDPTEAGSQNVPVSGQLSGAFDPEDDVAVTVTVNGRDYPATVQPDGTWTANVDGADLAAAGTGQQELTVTVDVTDEAGNTTTTQEDHSYLVSAPPDVTTTVTVAGDDIVNSGEAGSASVPVSGIVNGITQPGDTVTLVINGHEYPGIVIDEVTGEWSVNVDGAHLAENGEGAAQVAVTLNVTDEFGVSSTVESTHDYAVDTVLPDNTTTGITVDDVTEDNTLNDVESQPGALVSLSGTVTGEYTVGDAVTVTANGNTYTTTVGAGGSWSVDVPGADLVGNTFDVEVAATDEAGNVGSASITHTAYDVLLAGPAAALSFNPVLAQAGDGNTVLNQVEASGIVPVSGTTTDAQDGDLVKFTINGNEYTAVVTNNTWSVDVRGEDLEANNGAPINGTLYATDPNGNSTEVNGSSAAYTVDTTAPNPTPILNDVDGSGFPNSLGTGDVVTANDYVPFDPLNGGFVTISGQVSDGMGLGKDQDWQEGNRVTFTLNGEEYETTLDADGNWFVEASGIHVVEHAGPPNSPGGTSIGEIHATLYATDAAGNTATVQFPAYPYEVDTAGIAGLVINSVTEDNVLNAAESGSTIPVSGYVLFDEPLQPGAKVNLTIGGVPYEADVDPLTGEWTVDVAGADLLTAGGSFDATLTATDINGNPVDDDPNDIAFNNPLTSTRTYTLDTDAPTSADTTLTINPITADNVLDRTETADVTVSGSVSGEFQAGDVVTFTVSGTDYTTTVNADGSWSRTLLRSDFPDNGAALATDDITAWVAASDEAGNTAGEDVISATRTYTVGAMVPTFSNFVLDLITADDTTGAATGTGTNKDNVTANNAPRVTGTVVGLTALDVQDALAGDVHARVFVDQDGDGKYTQGVDMLLADNLDLFFANAAAEANGNASIRMPGANNNNVQLPLMANGHYDLRAELYNDNYAGHGPSLPGTLDGTGQVLTITTADTFNGLGWEVTSAGDFNGDGFEDFLVSAPNTQRGYNAAWESDVYVLYGNENGIDPNDVYDLRPNTGLHITMSGNTGTGGESGTQAQSLRSIGDINGDGYDDFAMGTHWNDRVYVVFGRDTSSIDSQGALDLRTLEQNSTRGDNGFVIRSASSAYFASSVAGGDLNGDGYADLIMGDIDGSGRVGGGGEGSYYVLYGREGAGSDAVWNNMFATRLNGDASLQYAINDGQTFQNNVANHVPDQIQVGTTRNEADLGHSSAVIGDVNGDGYNDYLVGAGLDYRDGSGSQFQEGAVFLVFGTPTGLPMNYDIRYLTPDRGIRLSGTENRELLGGSSREAGAGGSQGDGTFSQHSLIRGIGDINGDGIADFAIGSPHWGTPGQYTYNSTGRVYVVYGRDVVNGADDKWVSLNLGNLNGENGFIIENSANTLNNASLDTRSQFGFSISAGGDLNGDGIDDFLIGAPGADNEADANGNKGAAFIVFGQVGGGFDPNTDIQTLIDNGGAMRLDGVNVNEYAGTGVATGDWNGDGIAEFSYGRWEATTNRNGVDVTRDGTFVIGNTSLATGVQAGQNSYVGDADVNLVAGTAGNDSITGIGVGTAANGQGDVALGGAGNDLIGIVGTDFTRVDGGLGYDTLRFDQAINLDLRTAGLRVQGFEHFDMNGQGSELHMRTYDVLQQGDSLQLAPLDDSNDPARMVRVSGGGSDTVHLWEQGVGQQASGLWTDTGTQQTIGGVVYNVWTNGDTTRTGDLLIQDGMQVQVHAYVPPPAPPSFGSFVLDLVTADDTRIALNGDIGTNTDNITQNTAPRITAAIAGLTAPDVAAWQAGKITATLFDDANNNGVLEDGERVFAEGLAINVTNVNTGAATFANVPGVSPSGQVTLNMGHIQGQAATANSDQSYNQLPNSTYNLRGILVNSDTQEASAVGVNSGTLDGKDPGIGATPADASVNLVVRTYEDNDGLGYTMTNVGDFNGDGVDDFVVSATHLQQRGGQRQGSSDMYLLYGSEAGLPDVASVYNMTPEQGIHFTFNSGFDQGANFDSVTALGDINGDGLMDFAAASHKSDRGFVIFGQADNDTGSIDLYQLTGSGDNKAFGGDISRYGFTIRGGGDAYFAGSIGGGDLNGDGYGDIMIGGPDRGQYWVLYGHEGAAGNYQNIDATTGTGWGNVMVYHNAIHYLGTNQFMEGQAAVNGGNRFGEQVRVIGDVNGDGYNDYIASGPLFSGNGFSQAGAAYLIFGTANGAPVLGDRTVAGATVNLSTMTSAQGVQLLGTETGEWLSGDNVDGGGAGLAGDGRWAQTSAISNIGDVNGDGIADFAIGSPYWGDNRGDLSAPGRVYVVYGRDGNSTPWANMSLNSAGMQDGSLGAIFNLDTNTTDVNGQLGFSVSGVGDVNGDGIDDFVIGGPAVDPLGVNGDSGSVFLVYGQQGGFTPTSSRTTAPNAPDAGGDLHVELGLLVTNGEAVRFNGATNLSYTGTGTAVGDWNGDGLADVAYGSWEANNLGVRDGAFFIKDGIDYAVNGFVMGTAGNDALQGTAGVDRISGGAGNDVITGNIGVGTVGSGSGLAGSKVQGDVVLGGAGDDYIAIVGTDFSRVDGGLGVDTLRFDAGLDLDLATAGLKVQGFEIFDLGTSGSTLGLRLADVLSQPNGLGADGLLTIKGSNGTVDLAEYQGSGNTGGWGISGTQTVGGVTYDVWHNSNMPNTNGDLLIDQGLSVI